MALTGLVRHHLEESRAGIGDAVLLEDVHRIRHQDHRVQQAHQLGSLHVQIVDVETVEMGDSALGVRSGPVVEPQRRLSHHPGGAARHARGGLGPHRQHLFIEHTLRISVSSSLRGRQVRGEWINENPCTGIRPGWHHRQRRPPGLHRHTDAPQGGGAGPARWIDRGEHRQGPGRQGGEGPKTSRRRARSSFPRRPATSPDRSSASTADLVPSAG